MGSQHNSFLVIGSGAVGSLFALILNQNRTTVKFSDLRIGYREPLLIQCGASLKDTFDATVEIGYAGVRADYKPSFIIVSVKYSRNFTKDLMKSLEMAGEDVPILLLQNSYRHVKELRNRLPNHIVAGMLSKLEIYYSGKNLMLARAPFSLNLPIEECVICKQANFEERFDSQILNLNVSGSEEEVIWNKLVRWIPLSTVTSVCRLPIGEALKVFPTRILNELVSETCSLAEAESGTVFEVSAIIEQLHQLPKLLTTSSMRDAMRGRTTELLSVLEDMEKDLHSYGLPSTNINKIVELLN